MPTLKLNWLYSTLCGVMVVSASGEAALAGEPQIKYHDEASGSFTSTVIDTNQDGVPGITTNLQGRSSLGPVSITSFSEFDPFAALPSENCAPPKIEFPLVESTTIHRFVGGDLLYLRTAEEIFCADLSTGEFEWTETLVIIGGTGKYSAATGTIEASGAGNVLSSDPTGILNFGGLSMTNQGIINVPRGGR